MSDIKIVNYYLLNSFDKLPHTMSTLSKNELNSLLSEKEQMAFFKMTPTGPAINETVIGGSDISVSANTIIRQYYLLNSTIEKVPHTMSDLSKNELGSLLSTIHQDIFFRSLNGKRIVNETIIGGDDTLIHVKLAPQQNNIMIF